MITLYDDGTLDTCFLVRLPDGHEALVRYHHETAAPYRDSKTGELDMEAFLEDWEDDMYEAAIEDKTRLR